MEIEEIQDTVNEEKPSLKKDDINFYLMNSPTGSSNTSIPVEVGFGKDVDTFFNEPLPENMPQSSKTPYKGVGTFTGAFAKQEEFYQLGSFLDRQAQDSVHLDNYVPKDWSPLQDPTVLIGVNPIYKDYLLSAKGPDDQRRRYDYILDQQENDDKIANGGLFQQYAGGMSGALLSPSSLLAWGKVAKYATYSKQFLYNLPRVLPSVGLSSAAHEAVIESSKIGGNLKDWAIDTFADTVLATAFFGGAAGVAHSIEAGKLFNAKGVIKMIDDGIEPRPVLNQKGEHVGWKAIPIDSSVGAAQVNMAQVYLDASLAKNSLYSIPGIGPKVGEAAGKTASYLGSIVNPIIRMQTSRFPTMRGLINNVAEHGFDTEGVEAGRPTQTPFESYMREISGSNVAIHTQYRGLYLQRNGVEYDPEIFGSRTKANLVGLKQKYLSKPEDFVSEETFGREVQNVLVNEEESQHAPVNEAAELLRESMDVPYKEWLGLNGYSPTIMPPVTSKGYASRVYNAAYMELNEHGDKGWIATVSNELQKYDKEINELMEPINSAKEQYKLAESQHQRLARRKNISDIEIKKSSDTLQVLQKRITEHEERLQNNLRENEDLHLHVEDRFALSANEAKQIKVLQKPLENIKKEIEKQKEVIKNISKVSYRKNQATKKSKTAKTAKKQASLADMSAKDLEIEQRKLRQLEDKYQTTEDKLMDRIGNGEIDSALYFKPEGSNQFRLKDPANRLKLRETYESDYDRQTAAKAYYDSILSQTAEDNIRNILGSITNNEKENPLKRRTLLLRDKFLYDNNWLHPDPSINVMNYRMAIGRQNAIKKTLNRLTINGTVDELISRLAKEHEIAKLELRDNLNSLENDKSDLDSIVDKTEEQHQQLKELDKKIIKETKKYEKNVKKLGKEYKVAKEDLDSVYNSRMLGRSKYSAKSREYSKIGIAYAASTRLLTVPIAMSSDLMGTVFKHGLWPNIRDGLIPMLKTLGGTLNTPEGRAIRENAAHAHLAMNHINMAYSDKQWTGTSQTYEPVQGKLTTGMETVAHYSSNFALTNYIENFTQRWTANVVQSKIMKAMMAYKDGKLDNQSLKDLLRYGLDPKEFADRFVSEWELAGKEGSGTGAYQSRYWTWQDLEASNAMSRAMMRATYDTIIRKGMFDAPFAMDNPLIKSVYAFMGYTFASVTRFLTPLLHRPDARKMLGTMLMLAAGATQTPLRRLANGKDPVQKDDNMFLNAIRDGGPFSIFSEPLQAINFLTNDSLSEIVSNEKYRHRTEMGAFNGPIGGAINDFSRIMGALLHNEMNQTDLKRLAYNIPPGGAWELRGIINKWIESSDYPKTRGQAHKEHIGNY